MVGWRKFTHAVECLIQHLQVTYIVCNSKCLHVDFVSEHAHVQKTMVATWQLRCTETFVEISAYLYKLYKSRAYKFSVTFIRIYRNGDS